MGYFKYVTDWPLSGFGTDNHSPGRKGKIGFSGSKVEDPPRPWPQATTSLINHVPGFRQGPTFLLHKSGTHGNPWFGLDPNTIPETG